MASILWLSATYRRNPSGLAAKEIPLHMTSKPGRLTNGWTFYCSGVATDMGTLNYRPAVASALPLTLQEAGQLFRVKHSVFSFLLALSHTHRDRSTSSRGAIQMASLTCQQSLRNGDSVPANRGFLYGKVQPTPAANPTDGWLSLKLGEERHETSH